MKPSLLTSQPSRRGSHRQVDSGLGGEGGGGAASAAESVFRSPTAAFWIVLHGVCCVISVFLGFRFSRVVFVLLFSPSSTTTISSVFTSVPALHAAVTNTTTTTTTQMRAIVLASSPPPPPPPEAEQNSTKSHVVVGRHGIRIRPWTHPDSEETMRAHWIIERVQREQRLQHGVRTPRPLIVVTPTYARTFQTLHLTGLLHSLLLVPFPLTWLVVEAASSRSNDTAAFLARSGLHFLHVPFPHPMPEDSRYRRTTESRMRLHALRVVRDRGMDGIVVFADDSNVHSMELFDEAQRVKWMGAISMRILTHITGLSTSRGEDHKSPVPIQGPACNSSGHLVGWHTYNPLPNTGATFIGAGKTVLPAKMEWAGFMLNSRLLWREAKEKPDWVRDLDEVGKKGEDIDSPLCLLEDASFVEPLGNCGRKVLLWWLRAEARYDSNFPTGWTLEPVLEATAAANHSARIDASPELPSNSKLTAANQDSRNNNIST
ncbi:probable beta-1,4-xylosyltransferase IRX14 [Zingiber officinale]|uniref:probable beta-1,4-xylosyltransferase IRX14 n=1 Tax=Zingiber officinale TaxID=94328 RepID=UPI001C4CF65B|nr:probable beta-1,4-xylosyltransferase IRX14 [Zingiber officinale]XP_042462549.1 probable beta-1,4-xylosyltransferase IRX14 [Zingiber officinale]XP_042462558.1 probable beta-1,4-xylosyltransferase IRX14 [Zingiber officinale]